MSAQRAACWAVACPHCGAEKESTCVTSSGKALPVGGQHRSRWTEHSEAFRTLRFRMELLEEDARFGLSAGDILICQHYWLDPQKVTVVRRERDGFDPECNQYKTDVKFLEFIDEAVP